MYYYISILFIIIEYLIAKGKVYSQWSDHNQSENMLFHCYSYG
jgi:hypothetical protein